MYNLGEIVDLSRPEKRPDWQDSRVSQGYSKDRRTYIYGLIGRNGFGYVGCSIYPAKRYWDLEHKDNELGVWIREETPVMVILEVIRLEEQSKRVRYWGRNIGKTVYHRKNNTEKEKQRDIWRLENELE
jgi:hypothetical protein